jgi:hypothetical protein
VQADQDEREIRFGFTSRWIGIGLKRPGMGWALIRSQILPKFYYAKRRFPITSKCMQMHGVLNVDKIKN